MGARSDLGNWSEWPGESVRGQNLGNRIERPAMARAA
jgi:hypothetical protein